MLRGAGAYAAGCRVIPVGRRVALTVAGFGTLAVAAVVTAPLIGSSGISLARVFDRSIPFADNTDAQIFFIARLPRTLAGASGLCRQAARGGGRRRGGRER